VLLRTNEGQPQVATAKLVRSIRPQWRRGTLQTLF